ncbi:MAG TPA: hypothetical protein EYN60_07220 [Nitrospirales bacterium]|nr:hypothetical protein [Nitrospirales bacterium]
MVSWGIKGQQETELCMIRGLLVFCILTLGLGCSSIPEVVEDDGRTGAAAMEGSGAMGAADQGASMMEDHENVTRIEDERVSDSLIIVGDEDSDIAAARLERQDASKTEIIIEKTHTVFEDIYFDFDHWEIPRPMQARLSDHARWLKANRGPEVLIEGYCDVRGSREYNMVLGEKRAQRAKTFFMKSGVNGERISIISYGKERLDCLDETEACHSTNRRAHIALQ